MVDIGIAPGAPCASCLLPEIFSDYLQFLCKQFTESKVILHNDAVDAVASKRQKV